MLLAYIKRIRRPWRINNPSQQMTSSLWWGQTWKEPPCLKTTVQHSPNVKPLSIDDLVPESIRTTSTKTRVVGPRPAALLPNKIADNPKQRKYVQLGFGPSHAKCDHQCHGNNHLAWKPWFTSNHCTSQDLYDDLVSKTPFRFTRTNHLSRCSPSSSPW